MNYVSIDIDIFFRKIRYRLSFIREEQSNYMSKRCKERPFAWLHSSLKATPPLQFNSSICTMLVTAKNKINIYTIGPNGATREEELHGSRQVACPGSCAAPGPEQIWRRRDEARDCPSQGRHGRPCSASASRAPSRRARSTPSPPPAHCAAQPRGSSAPPHRTPAPTSEPGGRPRVLSRADTMAPCGHTEGQ